MCRRSPGKHCPNSHSHRTTALNTINKKIRKENAAVEAGRDGADQRLAALNAKKQQILDKVPGTYDEKPTRAQLEAQHEVDIVANAKNSLTSTPEFDAKVEAYEVGIAELDEEDARATAKYNADFIAAREAENRAEFGPRKDLSESEAEDAAMVAAINKAVEAGEMERLDSSSSAEEISQAVDRALDNDVREGTDEEMVAALHKAVDAGEMEEFVPSEDYEETFDSKGYSNTDGFNTDGYDRTGYTAMGYDSKGFDKSGNHRDTKDEFDNDGLDRDGVDYNGFDANHIHPETGTRYNEDGLNYLGADSQGRESEDWWRPVRDGGVADIEESDDDDEDVDFSDDDDERY